MDRATICARPGRNIGNKQELLQRDFAAREVERGASESQGWMKNRLAWMKGYINVKGSGDVLTTANRRSGKKRCAGEIL